MGGAHACALSGRGSDNLGETKSRLYTHAQDVSAVSSILHAWLLDSPWCPWEREAGPSGPAAKATEEEEAVAEVAVLPAGQKQEPMG
jgi:hypothetical protein